VDLREPVRFGKSECRLDGFLQLRLEHNHHLKQHCGLPEKTQVFVKANDIDKLGRGRDI
jgi:hypothetical protein